MNTKPTRYIKSSLLLLALVWGSSATAAQNRHAGHDHSQVEVCDLVPNTNFRFPDGGQHPGGVTKKRFELVLNAAEQVYGPIFQKMGSRLIIRNLWHDDTPNAAAYPGRFPYEVLAQKEQDGTLTEQDMSLRYRRVDMYGGLARHPEMTTDAMMMVLCHEIGHHIGGSPVREGFWAASNEGQADYFAAAKCMRKILSHFDNVQAVKRIRVDSDVRMRCSAAHQRDPQQAALCIRTSMAGLSLARTLASLGNSRIAPRFDTPDRSVVNHTYDQHPAAQCRLDTYFQGSLCRVSHDVDMTFKNPISGACRPERVTTGSMGYRPSCWFNPKFYENPQLLLPLQVKL